MRALVTGGAGFIGSHLVDRLIQDGYEVQALDNLSEGNLKNVAHLKNNSKFSIQEADLKDAKSVEKLVSGKDTVFHLAAHANIRTSLVDHSADLSNNLVGTLNILDSMQKHNVKNLVFASTSALYGEATITPTPEDYMPVQTSLYGASKLACEAYAQAFVQFMDLHFWAYRFSNIIGERCRRGVIWDFINKLKRNPKELEILGDGKQSKEYLHVSDCVDGIMTGFSKSKTRVNAFNLAIEENSTPDQVADIVIREMGLKDVKRKYTGGSRGWIGDNPLVHLSIDRIKALGWHPKVSSSEAITRTARWSISEIS
ncbi:MAG TPA: SDR family NAD(P)-dependent oxidoreductase [Nitrososphaerales archaeon]|nr:SDR family NAD(P)-dependent oxidoreductase [Nitrososphaerales archaeon]